MIRASLAAVRETDSPIFKMLPALPEVDPTTVQVVPQDFTEEVGRASAAKSHGWLRLLAVEVQGRRFQWPALRLIGRAQWAARDYDGATESWAQVRSNDPDDVAANLALANLYERQYGRDKRPELLASSNQAIARVLANNRTSASHGAEALALEGRNAKTLWRLEFEGLPELAERRQRATSQNLLKSYKSYRAAYLFDLNHFWSGLAALQMASAAKSLSVDPSWEDIFDDAQDARKFAEELERQIEQLRASVGLAIQAAIDRSPTGEERMWAEISRADLMFLNDKQPPARVKNSYTAAVPEDNLFAWEAVAKQLSLFANLNIRSDLAKQDHRDARREVQAAGPGAGFARRDLRRPPDRRGWTRSATLPGGQGAAGQGVDPESVLSGSNPEARVSWSSPRRLRAAIFSATKFAKNWRSAAPSACRCLWPTSPARPLAILARPLPDLDVWRSRFLALIDGRAPLQLSDQEGLPRWLEGTGINPWERGNQWVLEMALTKSRKVSLVAFWDGKRIGDDKGGTAHMVEIARDAGTVDVAIINAQELLTDDAVKPV